MKTLFINEADDMKWLFETALKSANIWTRDGDTPSSFIDLQRNVEDGKPEPCAAIVYGNEDSPDRIEVYASMEPEVGHAHVLYVLNVDGLYDECFVPTAKISRAPQGSATPSVHSDDDAERNCAHEWNMTPAEADEAGPMQRIYCLKCGQDGDA